jgi:hypothetical protein
MDLIRKIGRIGHPNQKKMVGSDRLHKEKSVGLDRRNG